MKGLPVFRESKEVSDFLTNFLRDNYKIEDIEVKNHKNGFIISCKTSVKVDRGLL